MQAQMQAQMQPQAQGATPRPHRRSRIPLSCDPCRSRKLKCNREKPCQNCIARNDQEACRFQASHNVAASHHGRDMDANIGIATRHRISHLEDLVKSLIEERQKARKVGNTSTPESLDVGQSVTGTGKTIMEGVHSVYLGGDDWNTVLQEIHELKRTWSQDHEDQQDQSDTFRSNLSHTVDGASLLFNQIKPIERIEILSSLPSKPEIDRLIAQFFARHAFPIAVPPILHEPTFMREYDQHWRDPSRSSFIWLGLLFSVLGITMLACHQYGEPPEYEGIAESLSQLYRMRTAQCLQSGDIAKCLPYTVETLRFNATAELSRRDDNRRGLWIMAGVVVRAAINMGYHRDPSQSPGISPLQAEYRRRVWLSVTSLDDTASFVAGFPRMTAAIYSDTMEPRNIHDWELSEDATSRLFRAMCRISDFNNIPNPSSYKAVLEIDQAVYSAYDAFPLHMKVPPDMASGGDRTGGITLRSLSHFPNLTLLGMYHKGMCTLHCRFLAKARVDSRFHFSRDRCISSALALLAFQPGLEPPFYRLSQTRQMLTLGAMVLLLELELRRKTRPETCTEVDECPDSHLLMQALKKSRACWADVTNTCDEAYRAHEFLAGMLSGLEENPARDASSHTVSPGTPPEMLEFSELPAFETLMANGGFSFEDDPFNMDIDWTTWDAFVEEPGAGDAAGPMFRGLDG
ncbi:hypothetical protein B0T17DRAFT_590466 [Bombardia bombarda]|uniref:Zn(2)-C6 fungal-type domain-containing protein n=1 Tax=Bombardia bombarda TaxID=252184 RepID=A0AA40C4B0_9PEZI|nr:hypothetical protein B0T17DRAFT_590466 [Bombardia bombarda]